MDLKLKILDFIFIRNMKTASPLLGDAVLSLDQIHKRSEQKQSMKTDSIFIIK